MEERLWKMNKLICGDNSEELAKLPKESVDLIYIDPPFFTHKKYEVVWGDEAEVRSYKDRWEGGIEYFIGWLKPRVQAMYEVLKPTGSFYLHCDWHANAHIRIMLDEIFGPENFLNEIVWNYEGPQSPSPVKFASKHDVILRYAKSIKDCVANELYYFDKIPISEAQFKQDEVGRYFYTLPKGDYTDESIQKLEKEGRIFRTSKGTIRIKYFVEKTQDGYFLRKKKIPDVWTDIPSLGLIAQSKEVLGYPTQKPEALLERIIKASSNKGDVVLDAFCGCGTTVAVAQRLGRRWIGVDISPTAIKIMQRRLEGRLGMIEGVNYEVIGLPTTVEEVRKLEPFEFQNWVVIDKMRANASRKKVGDMGLDGYYPRSILTEEAGIQVKQSDGVGRNVIDNFETALKRAGYKKGYIVAFSFSSGAYEEVARIKNKGELDIKLITVEELLTKHKI